MALSPMMQQYFTVKDQVPDALLFFRVGDFYEMFFEDALTASKALELTLTGKDCGLEERAPMCGVPFHAVDTYVTRLVEQNFRDFIERALKQYDVVNCPVGVVGGFGYACREILQRVGAE